jgi:hypothetical protein
VAEAEPGCPIPDCNEILGDERFDGKWRDLCLRFGIKSIRSAPVKEPEGLAVGSFVLGYQDVSTDERWDQALMATFAELGLKPFDFIGHAVAGAH